MMKTSVTKKDTIKPEWILIDASGVRLGKLATSIAKILQGKEKATYCPNLDCGDYVIVINSKKVDFHPTRREKKIYWQHSGYPGGIRKKTLGEMLRDKPNEVIKKAVRGMLPKTRLGRAMMKKLFVYAEEKHGHEAQKPKLIEIK